MARRRPILLCTAVAAAALMPTPSTQAGFGWLFHCHREKSCSECCEEKPRCCFNPPSPPRGETVESTPARITGARADRAPAPKRAPAGPNCAPVAPGVPPVEEGEQPATPISLQRRIRLLEMELNELRIEATASQVPQPPESLRR